MKPHPIYLKAARGEWLTHADVAKLIRSALAVAFPAARFSVTTKTYSGGGSVHIRWQDGPTAKEVDAIANQFQTRHFDGMIDMAHDSDLWLYPDGTAHVAHDPGTAGSLGTHSEIIEDPKSADAVLVEKISGAYVFSQRTVTPRAFRRAIAEYRAQNWVGTESVDWDAIEIATSDYDGSGYLKNCPNIQPGNGYRWLSDELCRLAYSYDLTEPEPEAPAAPEPTTPAHAPVLCW